MTFQTLTQKNVIEAFGGRDADASTIGGSLAKADAAADKNTIVIVRALAKFVPVEKKERNAWKAEMAETYTARRNCSEATGKMAINRYACAALVYKLHKEDVPLRDVLTLYKSDGSQRPAKVAEGAKPATSSVASTEPTEPRREEADGAASLAAARGHGVDVGNPALRQALAAFASHPFKLGKMESADADLITSLLAAIRGGDDD